jgi:hypothetical protein
MPIDLLLQLGSAAIRASGLSLSAFAGLLLFRVRSSAARHAIWTAVLAGMVLQIPLGLVAPTVSLKALPASIQLPIQPPALGLARVSATATPSLASRTRPQPKHRTASESATLAGVYLAVSMLLLVRMAFGQWGLRRVLRGVTPLAALGPGIFESSAVAVPGAIGCFRRRILLPRAWRNWSAAELQAVLAHERAHIRRQDWLIRVASRVNVCIFWFHPLAWWMERELARLAEEACDDAALSQTGNREEYAATLVDIARAAAAGGAVLNWQVSMARDSNVTQRVNRILAARLPLPKPFGRLACVTLFACSMPVIYLCAAVQLAPATPHSIAPRHAAVPEHPREAPSAASLIAQATPDRSLQPAPQPSPKRREDSPITLCIVIDNSGSMRAKQPGVKAAALALVKASRPQDEVCIVNFNDEAFLDLAFTSDIGKMQETLTHYESRGGKAMRDAVGMSIDHMERVGHNARKVVVLVTDGYDSASTLTQEHCSAGSGTALSRSTALGY